MREQKRQRTFYSHGDDERYGYHAHQRLLLFVEAVVVEERRCLPDIVSTSPYRHIPRAESSVDAGMKRVPR